MGLKEIYETWTFKVGNTIGNKGPREQSEGAAAVNYMPDTYQTEVRNRAPGDTTAMQSTEDDSTKGTFRPQTAFRYYTSMILNTFLTRYPRTGVGKLVHKFNAQGTDQDKYLTSNEIKRTPGALYNTNS